MKGERDVERRDRVVAALREGLTVAAACKRAGLSRAAVYAWRARGGDTELEDLLAATASTRSTAPKGHASRARPARPAKPIPAAPLPPAPAPAPAPVDLVVAAPTAPAPTAEPRVGLGPVDPSTGRQIPDAEFVTRLHALGLGVLARLADGAEKARSETARVAAAKELVQHAERWAAARRVPLEDQAPDAARTAPRAPAEPELTADEVKARFRVVS